MHLLAAQRHPRPAVLAHRPDLLPQPADLFRRRTCRRQVIPMFHYALRPGGYLFLGTSENVTPVRRPVRAGRQEAPHLPPPRRCRRTSACRCCLRRAGGRAWRRAGAAPARRPRGMALRQAVEAQVLERFAPAHVVVNRDGDVVHYSAAHRQVPGGGGGQPSRQLLAMARKGLRLDLRAALREAMETRRRRDRASGIAVEVDDGRSSWSTLTVEPLQRRRRRRAAVPGAVRRRGPGAAAARRRATGAARRRGRRAPLQLERELRETRERLQSMIEEYETALEELKSANEELVSVNEELQSTNEELETSQGGAAVGQRGAAHRQRRAARQGRGARPGQRRPAQPVREHARSPPSSSTATW